MFVGYDISECTGWKFRDNELTQVCLHTALACGLPVNAPVRLTCYYWIIARNTQKGLCGMHRPRVEEEDGGGG